MDTGVFLLIVAGVLAWILYHACFSPEAQARREIDAKEREAARRRRRERVTELGGR